jgi:hypothetical protein
MKLILIINIRRKACFSGGMNGESFCLSSVLFAIKIFSHPDAMMDDTGLASIAD